MPTSYTIDSRRCVVFSRWWGVVTDAQLRAEACALRQESCFEPTFRLLADLRGIERFEITVDGIHDVAALNPFERDVQRALLVDSDLSFGIARMYHSWVAVEPNCTLISRSPNDAVAWLGLDANILAEGRAR